MKALKQNANSIIISLFEILVGILLLINPIGFTSGIIVTFGIILIFISIISIIKYFRMSPETAVKSRLLLVGLITLMTGLFCTFKSHWFVATFPLLTILYGIAILITGLGKVQWAVDMLRLKKKRWFLPAISAALSLICATVILMNPFTSTTILWIFTGVTLIIESVFDIIAMFLGKENTV